MTLNDANPDFKVTLSISDTTGIQETHGYYGQLIMNCAIANDRHSRSFQQFFSEKISRKLTFLVCERKSRQSKQG